MVCVTKIKPDGKVKGQRHSEDNDIIGSCRSITKERGGEQGESTERACIEGRGRDGESERERE